MGAAVVTSHVRAPIRVPSCSAFAPTLYHCTWESRGWCSESLGLCPHMRHSEEAALSCHSTEPPLSILIRVWIKLRNSGLAGCFLSVFIYNSFRALFFKKKKNSFLEETGLLCRAPPCLSSHACHILWCVSSAPGFHQSREVIRFRSDVRQETAGFCVFSSAVYFIMLNITFQSWKINDHKWSLFRPQSNYSTGAWKSAVLSWQAV